MVFGTGGLSDSIILCICGLQTMDRDLRDLCLPNGEICGVSQLPTSLLPQERRGLQERMKGEEQLEEWEEKQEVILTTKLAVLKQMSKEARLTRQVLSMQLTL